MPTYIETADNSDLSPSWANTTLFNFDMFTGASGGGNTNNTISGGATVSAAFITLAAIPNSDAWESGGTQTVELEVSMGDPDFDCQVRIVRLSDVGVILQSGALTAIQTLDQDRIFSPVAPTWTGGQEDCDNRLAIELVITNNDSMSHSLKLNIRIVTAEIITDITEDGGTCGAPVGTEQFMNMGGADLD